MSVRSGLIACLRVCVCVCGEQEISRLIGGSLTLEDEDAVLLELAEIEALEAESLALALPEAPVESGASNWRTSRRVATLLTLM